MGKDGFSDGTCQAPTAPLASETFASSSVQMRETQLLLHAFAFVAFVTTGSWSFDQVCRQSPLACVCSAVGSDRTNGIGWGHCVYRAIEQDTDTFLAQATPRRVLVSSRYDTEAGGNH